MRAVLAFPLVVIAALPGVAHAQGAAGPSTSGGSLPYIMNSPSEDEVARRRKQRAAEAAAAAEQARAAEAAAAAASQAQASQAQAVAPQPAPATTASTPATAVRGVTETAEPKAIAVQPVTDAPTTAAEPAKPKAVATKPKQPPAGSLPPGITAEGRAGPPSNPTADRLVPTRGSAVAELAPAQPPVVYKPMFFGLFGPSVATTPQPSEVPPMAPAPNSANGRLRQFEPGSAGVIARQGRQLPPSNCHYHANANDGLQPHRDIRCHWHQDPFNPSLRYVQ